MTVGLLVELIETRAKTRHSVFSFAYLDQPFDHRLVAIDKQLGALDFTWKPDQFA